jgi:hypothetical protein
VRRELLFLSQFLGCSLVLFTFGHQLLHGYTFLLGRAMDLIDPSYPVSPDMEHFLYGSSMVIIAFIALVLSTPEVSLLKRAVFMTCGVAAFFLTDLLFIQFGILPHGRLSSNEDSPVFELYLCMKWLLPFLLWITMSRHLMVRLLNAAQRTGKAT